MLCPVTPLPHQPSHSDIPLNHVTGPKSLASAAIPLTPDSAAAIAPSTATTPRLQPSAASTSTSNDGEDDTSVDAELALKVHDVRGIGVGRCH